MDWFNGTCFRDLKWLIFIILAKAVDGYLTISLLLLSISQPKLVWAGSVREVYKIISLSCYDHTGCVRKGCRNQWELTQEYELQPSSQPVVIACHSGRGFIETIRANQIFFLSQIKFLSIAMMLIVKMLMIYHELDILELYYFDGLH